uniref:Glutathione transferase, putative, expressed n=1 Tax=Oryza sativa subsp. japonica TaxID=39947 RepID=Q109S9_ORYSJ|nr:glutathione transferase, putative, expressed [Oryza sativa Japonica Group]BAG97134.1 unnamed protein product [Oryza sativa Japonica Group]
MRSSPSTVPPSSPPTPMTGLSLAFGLPTSMTSTFCRAMGADVQGEDRGGEGGGDKADTRGGGNTGGSLEGLLKGETLLRWRHRWARGYHAGCPYPWGEGDRGSHRCQDLQRCNYPPFGLMDGALR